MGTAQYARYDNTTDRFLQWMSLSERAEGRFSTDDFSGRVEAGWQRSFGGYNVTPFVGADVCHLSNDRFTEILGVSREIF